MGCLHSNQDSPKQFSFKMYWNSLMIVLSQDYILDMVAHTYNSSSWGPEGVLRQNSQFQASLGYTVSYQVC